VLLGAPTIHSLVPAASLDARLVAIELTRAPHHANPALERETLDVAAFQERYTSEIERQLAALEIRQRSPVHRMSCRSQACC